MVVHFAIFASYLGSSFMYKVSRFLHTGAQQKTQLPRRLPESPLPLTSRVFR